MSTGQQERTKSKDYVRDVEFVYKETHDGTPLCIGWIAITDFSGSISDEAIQGIRFRKGNILVGDNSTFSKFFPLSSLEASRANKCFAGEIHILHKDIVPNRQRIKNTKTAQDLLLDVIKYHFDPAKDNVPVNAAIAKANSVMHDLEIDLLGNMVNSGALEPDRMLIVDGPLQFIGQDTGKPEFADMFYNVIGVSKSFDPMLPTSSKARRGGTQIGAELLKLEYGERTPVFLKENSRHRKYGCWYLRIRPRNRVNNPLEGIIKIEKMAVVEDEEGLNSSVVDNISLSLLNEGSPTCFGRDKRWASHLYPIYLTETLIKSTFESDLVFMNNFKRDFR